MFQFNEPSTLGVPWVLSRKDKEKVLTIPIKILEDLKRYDLLGIDFLYQKYQHQYYGVILNEEKGFNMHLQVATFFNVMFNNVEQKFLILVVCPNHLIINWHYQLTVHGGFKVIIVGPQTCPQDFDEEHGIALLVSFSNVKLVEHLTEYNFFSVVIDHLDELANKLVVRKLRSDFNIGLTHRSFYLNPDQKLHWTMMNWCNPGCVGKLSDFYEVDNDNFANFRDNYRHWWFRLTWKFCDSFQKPTENELLLYEEKLSKWAKSNSLFKHFDDDSKSKKPSNKPSLSNRNKKSNGSNRPIKKEPVNIVNKRIKIENASLESDNSDVKVDVSVEHATTKKNIVKNAVKTSNSVLFCSSLSPKEQEDFQNHEDNDVLMSIINNTKTESSSTLHKMELEYKKQQILSQIFDDSEGSVKEDDESEDFFMSLLETDAKQKLKTQNSQYKSNNKLVQLNEDGDSPKVLSDSFNAKLTDIDNILRETDKLLKK